MIFMVVLHLYHGRHRPEEDMDDWEFDGPLFGPFKSVQITYAFHIKCLAEKGMFDMHVKDDCVEFAGCLYGDCTVLAFDENDKWQKERLAQTNRVLEVKDETLPLLIESYREDPGLLSVIEKRLKGEHLEGSEHATRKNIRA